ASTNVYVTGESAASDVGPFNYATVKYNSDGQEQWAARYDGPGNGDDEATGIALDRSGNVYVTGSSAGLVDTDYATVNYDSSGQERWVARYEGLGNGDDIARAIVVDSLANVYVTGGSHLPLSDYATIKYVSGATPTATPSGTPTGTPQSPTPTP